MINNTVLMVIGKDASKDVLARQFETLRAMPARAAVLVVAEVPNFPYYAVGIPPYGSIVLPADWQEEMTGQKKAIAAKEEEIEALLAEHDVSGEVMTVVCEPAMVSEAVGRRAMMCDMALVGDDLRASEALYSKVVHGVLLQSPVGAILNAADAAPLAAPACIMVAWNSHLNSASAVHQALPLLKSAQKVIIASIDPVMTEHADGEDPGVDVAKWLTHHGCSVEVQQFPSGGMSVGECILARAKELGADLVVMGSYGHSRAREAIFGGTTRTMIEQTSMPVFLGH